MLRERHTIQLMWVGAELKPRGGSRLTCSNSDLLLKLDGTEDAGIKKISEPFRLDCLTKA